MIPAQHAALHHHLVWFYPDDLRRKLNAAPTLQITRGLRQLGWQVDLLVGGFEGRQEIQGVEVTGIPRPDTFFVKQLVYHLQAMAFVLERWSNTSIVFFLAASTPWVLLLRLAGLLKRGSRPLFVMDTRTMQMEKDTLQDRLRARIRRVMNMLANRFADGQTAITPHMAEVYRIPASRLWGTWPSGVDIDTFSTAALARRWPGENEPVRVIYIGSLARGRDLMPLCVAVEKANQEGMRFELALVGDGSDRERIAAFAARTAGRVCLGGRIPHEHVPRLLAGAHIGALPFPDELEFRVSSPIKLFEYLGAGLAILATRITCHTDVMGSQACAFYAKDSSVEGLTLALREIWQERHTLAQRGHQASALAREYTWEASSKKLALALESGLAARGRQPA